MNRAERRKFKKDQEHKVAPERVVKGTAVMSHYAKYCTKQPDFSSVPLATMCQSIQLLISELNRRGYPVYDFDNKEKFIQGIQIIHGKVYFLAAKEDGAHETV